MPITALMMQAVRNGAAMVAPSPTPTPTPTPSANLSFNFRSSQNPTTNWTGDAAPEIGIYGGPSAQLWNGTWGYNAPASNNLDTGRAGPIDRRIYGRQAFSNAGTTFGIAAPTAGSYGIEFAMGAGNVNDARCAVIIADSVDAGLRTNNPTAILSASGSASLNAYYVTNDQQRIYKCITPGTYATGNPAGTGSDVTDGGGAHFAFVANVLFIYDSGGAAGSLPLTSVVDIDGVVRTESVWPTAGSGAPKFLTVTLGGASPGITVMKYPSLTAYVRHVRLFSL